MKKETIFWTALKLPVSARSDFIDDVCSDEAECLWVKDMIRAHNESDDFLQKDAAPTEVDGKVTKPMDDIPRDIERTPTIPGCEIMGILGKGGMGTVYKGRQPGLERDVAVKFLQARIVDNVEIAERFRREAKAMAQLAHPHIVAIYDSGETTEGFPYFVMEFVKGEDLLQRIRREKLTEGESLEIAIKVCKALSFAHSNGFTHRDIKPQNILLGDDGMVKVADFGLVKLIENPGLTHEGAVMGTPHYWAPEQSNPALSGQVDHRADIYALGCTLYHMLCGVVPDKQYVAPSKICGCERRFDALIERCLASEPSLRYASADALCADLVEIRNVRPFRPRLLLNIVIVLFTFGLAALIAPTSVVGRLDAMIQDAFFAARPSAAVSDELVLVAITDDCLRADQLGAWPWDRAVHARLIDQLAGKGAGVIAFDMFLPDKGDEIEASTADRALADAAARHGNVIFPDFLDSSVGHIEGYAGMAGARVLVAGEVERAAPIIRDAGARPAQCHAERDDLDGKLRRVPLFLIDPSEPASPRPNLGLALALQTLRAEFSWSPGLVSIDLPTGDSIAIPVDDSKTIYVNYPADLDSIQAVSYSDVLSDSNMDLQGKCVVVGFTASGLTHVTADKHVTVISPNTPGVLVNAAIANSVLTGEFLREGSRWGSLVTGLFVSAILAFVFLKKKWRLGLVVAGSSAALILSFGYWNMAYGGLVFPVLPGLLVLLFGTVGLMFATRFSKRELKN